MSRVKRFFSGLIAGYAAAAANLFFTFFSVPVALHYLSKEEFGLWALVVQITGFLMLLDLGMTSSVARFLADHKDNKNQLAYGNVLQTGKLVFFFQALTLASITLLSGLLLPGWLEVPNHLIPSFQRLFWIQGLILSFGLALRGYASPLWAHQRIDITYWSASCSLLTALAALAVGFYLGFGLDSFWISSLLGALWTWLIPWLACHRLNFFPEPEHRGTFQFYLFLRMLRFGRDILFMHLGTLLSGGSQIILVTKFFGLEAAAVLSVATKMLVMGHQLIGRIFESASPGLTELFVRGERAIFVNRFYQILSISLVVATTLAVGLMTANRDFVYLWTHGSIHWEKTGDIFLAGILIVTVAVRCFQGVFGISGDLSTVRWLALREGVVFIFLTFLLHSFLTLEGFLALALGTQVFISLIPSLLQVMKTFPFRSFWNSIAIQMSLVVILAVLLTFLPALTNHTPQWGLIRGAILSFCCALSLIFLLGDS